MNIFEIIALIVFGGLALSFAMFVSFAILYIIKGTLIITKDMLIDKFIS